MNSFFLQIIFWFSFYLFIFNSMNFFVLIIYSEVSWVSLFTFSIQDIAYFDEILFGVLSFFIFAIAGLEFCIGILLLTIFKYTQNSLDFFEKKSLQLFKKNELKLFIV